MEVMYRDCELADFDGVFQLLLQLWPDKVLNVSQLKNVYQSGLNSNNQVYTCAVYNSQIVGLCSLTIKNNLWMQGNLGFIDELIVDEKYRAKGIGRKLLDNMIKLASERNCKRVELDSSFHRIKAHEFYSNLGFEKRAYVFSKVIE